MDRTTRSRPCRRRWTDQYGFVLDHARPLLEGHRADVVVPVQPEVLVPHTLQWAPERAASEAVARFVHTVLTAPVPDGWCTQSDHLTHQR